MATSAGGDERPDKRLLDYKTPFYGAISVILALCGVVWGVWNSNHDRQLESNRQTDSRQWERLSILNDTIISNTGRLERLEERAADFEARLRALERARR